MSNLPMTCTWESFPIKVTKSDLNVSSFELTQALRRHTCAFGSGLIMAEWAAVRKAAKQNVVKLDLKTKMAEAMKAGFESYMTDVCVSWLRYGQLLGTSILD